MKKLFLSLLFVMAVFALTSCDSLWEHENKEAVEISFTIPQEWLDSFVEEAEAVKQAQSASGGQSLQRASVDTSITANVSIHNAENDEVLAEQTVNIGENLNQTISLGPLYIVGETVYAQVELTQYGYKTRIEKTKPLIVKEGLNSIEFTFEGAAPIDIVSPTVGTLIGIPNGTYMFQGTEGGDVSLQESVTLASFYLAETEVTQGQWLEVMGSALPTPLYSFDKGDGENYPMYYVSWEDAIEFCNELSEKENLSPYYNSDGSIIDVNGTGYRLSTEREWEYAAGWEENGVRNTYAGTDTYSSLADYAWYDENANGTTHIVGTAGNANPNPLVKSGNANALGLYDMSGNVWEWCYDTWDSYLVMRGGSLNNGSSAVRVATRSNDTPNFRDNNVGFRVARSVAP